MSATVQGPVGVTVADARAYETDPAMTFTVTLSRAAAGAATVRYATRDGTATRDDDYTFTRGTVSFAAGETSKTVSVPILDDAIDEGEENVQAEAPELDRSGHRRQRGDRHDRELGSAAAGVAGAFRARGGVGRPGGGDGPGSRRRGTRARMSRWAGIAWRAGIARRSAAWAPSGRRHRRPARTGRPWSEDPGVSRTMTARELLTGTSFRAVLGQDTGSQLTAWGLGRARRCRSSRVPRRGSA